MPNIFWGNYVSEEITILGWKTHVCFQPKGNPQISIHEQAENGQAMRWVASRGKLLSNMQFIFGHKRWKRRGEMTSKRAKAWEGSRRPWKCDIPRMLRQGLYDESTSFPRNKFCNSSHQNHSSPVTSCCWGSLTPLLFWKLILTMFILFLIHSGISQLKNLFWNHIGEMNYYKSILA